MARNEEKSRSVLNRWYLYQRGDLLKPQEKRPKLTSTVDNVYECEKWRHEILKEISFKVEQIQNGIYPLKFIIINYMTKILL